MKQARIHTTLWFKQAGATACLLLLSFVLYAQAFHHHHEPAAATAKTQVGKFAMGKGHCAICDHIVTRSVSGGPQPIHFSLAPPEPGVYRPYSYYITIARELFLQAYTNKGPPTVTLSSI